jgi:uncharacterized delta-60 repeat protein
MSPKNRPTFPARLLAATVSSLGIALAALAQSPSPDQFDAGAEPSYANVFSAAIQADGKILAGGSFAMIGGQSRSGLARLNPDGTLDTSFNPGMTGTVQRIVLQADGKILVAGAFSILAGKSRLGIGRLNPDGTLDVDFDPRASGGDYGTVVSSVAVQADGKVLISGSFTMIGGQPRNGLARLNPDGTLDASFNQTDTHYTSFLALQPDGRILEGGWFSTNGATSGYGFYVGRLNADGSVDASFDPVGTDYGCFVALQADGKILVGGPFTLLRGQRRNYIGRLNTDGTLDAAFQGGTVPLYRANNVYQPIVESLAVQADGGILVGGMFGQLDGQTRHNLGRLNPDGTVDPSFDPQIADYAPTVSSLVLQGDGKILVGGKFTTVGGLQRTNIARLNNTGPATQNLVFDGSTLTWMRGGTSPEVWRATFEYSLNGSSWTTLGASIRVAGGWQLSGLHLPRNATIRARGYTMEGFVEMILRPPLLVSDMHYSTNSHFGFNASGAYGQVMVIEASPDLRSWTPLLTNRLGVGPIPFTDLQPPAISSRYYRLKSQP